MNDELVGQLMIDKDREYAMKFWSKERPEAVFGEMINTLEKADGEGKLQIDIKGYTKDTKEELGQLLSAHRRLGAALGMELDQFKVDYTNGYAVSRTLPSQDQNLLAARKDREYGVPFIRKSLETPGLLNVMMSNIKSSEEGGVIYTFAGGPLEEKDKAKLSALRVMGRAMGYKVGKWEMFPKAGTAGVKITR